MSTKDIIVQSTVIDILNIFNACMNIHRRKEALAEQVTKVYELAVETDRRIKAANDEKQP